MGLAFTSFPIAYTELLRTFLLLSPSVCTKWVRASAAIVGLASTSFCMVFTEMLRASEFLSRSTCTKWVKASAANGGLASTKLPIASKTSP